MATIRTVTVKPDGTGDYTTIANALAGESKDLVSLDRQLDVVIGAGIYTDPISDTGFVQSATCFLRIIAAPGAESSAVWRDSGVASIQPGLVATTAVTLGQYSRIERLQVSNDGSTASSNGLNLTGAVADRVFARLRNNGGSTFKLASGALLTNCVVWGGFYGVDDTASTLYNCSIYGATNGARGLSSPVARNVVAWGNGTDWSGNINNWVAPSSNIAGGGATFPRSPYVQLTASPWVDPANGDFSLFGGSPLIDVGADLSSVGVVGDIGGTTRPQGAAWDIGAAEFTSGAAPEDLSTTDSSLGAEASSITAAAATSDTGARTEASSLSAAATSSDSALGVEAAAPAAALVASDASTLVTESATVVMGEFRSATDAASALESAVVTVAVSATDAATGQEIPLLVALLAALDEGALLESAQARTLVLAGARGPRTDLWGARSAR